MATLPDPEQLGWMGLNRNLGLASGAELFAAIEQVGKADGLLVFVPKPWGGR